MTFDDIAKTLIRHGLTTEGMVAACHPLMPAVSPDYIARRLVELERERDEAMAHGNALYRAILKRAEPHFPADSRDLDWDVLPGTIGRMAAEVAKLRSRLSNVGSLLAVNGCDCDCDHHPKEHADDCELCLACRIGEEMKPND